MPNRILREGILSSERIAALGWDEEVFYRRLMSVVDDFGRFSANAKLVRAMCYPLHLEKVSDADIGKWLRATEKAGLVSVYPALDGKRYLELCDFRQQVRAKESKYPSRDAQVQDTRAAVAVHATSTSVAPATQMISTCVASAHLDVFGGGDVDGDVVGAPKQASPPSTRGTRLPADWVLPKAWGEWALAAHPHWDSDVVRKIAMTFANHWRAKSGKDATKLDWKATWQNWCTSSITQREFPPPSARRGVPLDDAALRAENARTTEEARRKVFGATTQTGCIDA